MHAPNLVLLMTLVTNTVALSAEPIAIGKSERNITLAEVSIKVHTYKPPQYRGGPILLVLHGLSANAHGYRDYAIPLANAHGYLLITPLFDRQRFPTWRYQHGGMVRSEHAEGIFQVEHEKQWAGYMILEIIEAVRKMESRPDLEYSMIGHSAGGQTLSRFAAFVPNSARHIIIANPSTYLQPSSERFPYGFGGLPLPLADDAALQRYLAQPVTILLGAADIERDSTLNVQPVAERQGKNRHERGQNVFRAAQQLAQSRGWPFHWRLIEVPNVGHSARHMFGSAQALDAFISN